MAGPGLASFSVFSPHHPVRLLSIYAFHREIGLNAYVKDPIKVARRTPCDVSIAPGTASTHMPRFPCCHAPVWSQIRFPNPINDSLRLCSFSFSISISRSRKLSATRKATEKFHFQFGNFFRMLWESLHTWRRVLSFASCPSVLNHLYAI